MRTDVEGEMDMMYGANPAMAFAASAGANAGVDLKQQFASERDELDLVSFTSSSLDGAEQRLLAARPIGSR